MRKTTDKEFKELLDSVGIVADNNHLLCIIANYSSMMAETTKNESSYLSDIYAKQGKLLRNYLESKGFFKIN